MGGINIHQLFSWVAFEYQGFDSHEEGSFLNESVVFFTRFPWEKIGISWDSLNIHGIFGIKGGQSQAAHRELRKNRV